ncbi:site-specific integrase [Geojedonia litorea]|uniref:Site-specific integrase n=1 Tax=Geojedonia litorea TaxID=1268269 RepID=A0ABV9N7M8_9FLAO
MKNRSTFSLLFWANTSRIQDNQVPVYARITVNGKRANISLQRKIEVSDWDASSGKAKGTKEQSRVFNRFLDQVRILIYEAQESLLKEKKLITALSIKARYLGEDETSHSLLELFDYHNAISENKLNKYTMKHYKTTQRYLKEYLLAKFKTDNTFLDTLNYSFIIGFEHFLKSHEPKDHQRIISNNTVMKHLQRLRKMVTMAYHIEWIGRDPFVRFKSSFEKKEREFLTSDELNAIEKFHSPVNRLNIIKDIFVFSCYTGISYIDINQLNKDHILKGIDGNDWIMTKRQKTNTLVKIPLLDTAKELINKYQDDPRAVVSSTLFPRFSNQKTNSYLKEIAHLCGIKKNLTFHMARHTFATTVTLSNGVPIETVSKLLGHSKIATTQIYARVIERKVSDDMQNLKKMLLEKQLGFIYNHEKLAKNR